MTVLLLAALALARPAAAETWTIDPSTGYFRVVLLKEGLLGGLGHDHVLDVRGARGSFEIGETTGAARVAVDAGALEIDAPAPRAEEGFSRPVVEGDRARSRAGMRGPKGLDVARYPTISFASTGISRVESLPGTWEVSGTFFLHGSSRPVEFPVVLAERPGGFWAYGYLRLRPSEFGIKPFSVLGGLIRVQDEALVRFNLGLRRPALRP